MAADWVAIEAKYVSSDLSYRELASKFNVSLSAVVRHSKNGNWIDKRQRYKNDVITKSLESSEENKINKLTKLIYVSDNIVNLLSEAVERAKEKNDIQPKEIKELVSTLKDLTITVRGLHDIPTEQENRTYNLAREKLDLEKDKQNQESNLDSITIEFMNNSDEWSG